MRTLGELESELEYQFKRIDLLENALIHRSHANERHRGAFPDNERLEFLGDAVLGLLISEFLYRERPTLTEGQLSKLKAFLVSSENLIKYAERIHLGDFVQLGKGEEKTGGRGKQAILVDALEAVIGSVYLDGGIEAARYLTLRLFERQIDELGEAPGPISDFKSELQEQLQANRGTRADYAVVGETGPDHRKVFTVEVVVCGEPIARGVGPTKKAAEQAAAMRAVERLRHHETTGAS